MFDMNKRYDITISGNEFNRLAWEIHEKGLVPETNKFNIAMRNILEKYFTKNEVKT